jgi:hypothetical protein
MRPNKTVLTVLAAVAATGMLAGCSSSGSPTAATSQPASSAATSAAATSAPPSSTAPSTSTAIPGTGACKYVTTDQASALAGSPVKAGVSRSLTSGPVPFEYCDYIFDPGNAPGVSVAVAKLGSNGAALYAQYRASKQSESDFQDVAGVGDEAFYASGDLNVRKGGTGLILFVGRINSSPRGAGAIPDEKQLAAIVLPQV